MDSAPWLAEGQIAGRWVDAGDLTVGDDVRRANGSTGDVELVEVVAVQQRMYNLTVDVAHTFFVGHGAWLVHNCGVPQLRLGHSDDLLKSDVLDYWQSQSTEDIVRSLLNDSNEHLAIRPDGTVLQGNHRIKVLLEKGYDTSKLYEYADIYPKIDLGP